MGASDRQTAIPTTRVASLLRYTHQLETVGAPVDRLLEQSRIPSVLLEHPEAVVPLPTAFRLGELSCQALGTEHLGLYVGLATSLEGLGRYEHTLQSSLTLYDYLCKGISLYSMLSLLWLRREESISRRILASFSHLVIRFEATETIFRRVRARPDTKISRGAFADRPDSLFNVRK